LDNVHARNKHTWNILKEKIYEPVKERERWGIKTRE
jgi:hypothetical protein